VLYASDGTNVTCAELEANGSSCGLFCETAFAALNSVMSDLQSATVADSTFDYTGITYLDGGLVPFTAYQTAVTDEIVNKESTSDPVTSYDKSIELLYESFCESTLLSLAL
jgi:hypothetical protein